MTSLYFTVNQIAIDLGVDPGKVLSWIHGGELRAINVAKNSRGRPRWRIPAQAWDEFQQSRSSTAATRPPQTKRRRCTDESTIEFY
jgi:hypothetical protein